MEIFKTPLGHIWKLLEETSPLNANKCHFPRQNAIKDRNEYKLETKNFNHKQGGVWASLPQPGSLCMLASSLNWQERSQHRHWTPESQITHFLKSSVKWQGRSSSPTSIITWEFKKCSEGYLQQQHKLIIFHINIWYVTLQQTKILCIIIKPI